MTLLTVLQGNLAGARHQAFWVVHPTSGWLSTPTGLQIRLGQLSNSSPAAHAGSEVATDTSPGSRQIDEATAITGLSAGVSYTLAWTVYDAQADQYATPAVGTVTPTLLPVLTLPTVTDITATTVRPRVTITF
jgi:hypothetical protein